MVGSKIEEKLKSPDLSVYNVGPSVELKVDIAVGKSWAEAKN